MTLNDFEQSDVRCTLFALIGLFCQRLLTLQRGLSVIADLLVLIYKLQNVSIYDDFLQYTFFEFTVISICLA